MPKKIILVILIGVILISCSNNQNESRVSDTTDSVTTQTVLPENGVETKSFDIKGFMSFTKETTFELAVSYFANNGIMFNSVNFLDNPQTQPSEYSMYQWPGRDYIFSDGLLKREWPLGRFIFLPELSIEGLIIKNVLFGFYNNYLSFISFGAAEWDYNKHKTRVENFDCFFQLQSFYKKKYGEGQFEQWGDNNDIWKSMTYFNNSNKFEVKFYDRLESSGVENQLKKRRLLFTIWFGNHKEFIDETNSYINEVNAREMQEKNNKEKKLLDNL